MPLASEPGNEVLGLRAGDMIAAAAPAPAGEVREGEAPKLGLEKVGAV